MLVMRMLEEIYIESAYRMQHGLASLHYAYVSAATLFLPWSVNEYDQNEYNGAYFYYRF